MFVESPRGNSNNDDFMNNIENDILNILDDDDDFETNSASNMERKNSMNDSLDKDESTQSSNRGNSPRDTITAPCMSLNC